MTTCRLQTTDPNHAHDVSLEGTFDFLNTDKLKVEVLGPIVDTIGGKPALRLLKTPGGSKLSASHGPPRAGDVRDSQADISKAAQLLGYRPLIGFEEGLARTHAWVTGGSTR